MIEDTIIPKIPTHEPFLRGTSASMPSSSGETPTQTSDSQKAGKRLLQILQVQKDKLMQTIKHKIQMKMFQVYQTEKDWEL